jgi:hypothetical protein
VFIIIKYRDVYYDFFNPRYQLWTISLSEMDGYQCRPPSYAGSVSTYTPYSSLPIAFRRHRTPVLQIVQNLQPKELLFTSTSSILLRPFTTVRVSPWLMRAASLCLSADLGQYHIVPRGNVSATLES